MRPSARLAVLIALFVCLSSLSLIAQTVTGTIEGRVMDKTGAVIPNAHISLRGEQTGLVREATTNAEGYYAFRFVPLGTYEVTAVAQGFRSIRKTGLEVALNTTTTSEFSMLPANVSEVVEVTGEVPLVDTMSSDVKDTFDTREVEDRPLPQRNFLDFAETVPGYQESPVIGSSNNPTLSVGSSVNFNGNGTRGATFQINGVNNDDSSENQQRQGVNISSIQQVQVLTNNFSAEFGRSYGTVVLVQTKQGTNRYHGEAFWFHFNTFTQARDFFQPARVYDYRLKLDSSGKTLCTTADPACYEDYKVPAARRHDFGGTFGGPILKNKLFFFASSEEIRWGGSRTFREDIFLPSEHSVPASVTNPADRAWIQKVLDAFPNATPNDPSNGPRAYLSSYGYHWPGHDVSGRIDWNINSKNTLSGRYQWSNQKFINDEVIKYEQTAQNNTQQNLGLTLSHIFSSTQTGEFRIGVGRRETRVNLRDASDGTWDLGRVPVIRFSNASNPGSYYASTTFGSAGAYPILRYQTDWQFVYNHYWMATPKLTVKFGTDVRPSQLNDFADSFTRGYWQMRDQGAAAKNLDGTTFTAAQWLADPRCPAQGQNETCPYKDAYWSLRHGMMGVSSGFTRSYGEASLANVSDEANFYLQADYRVTPSLTLMLGVRDEYVPELSERNHKVDYGYNDRNYFSPRFGFSYTPQVRDGMLAKVTGGPGKTVFHGGYGIFNGRLFQSFFNQSGASLRFTPPYGIDPAWDTTPDRTTYLPGYIADPTGGYQYAHTAPTLRIGYTQVDPKLYAPYSEQWNFSMQRELTHTMGLTLSYVGSHGVGLPFYNIINRAAFPFTAPTGMFANDSMAKFQGWVFDCVDPNVLATNPISPKPGEQCISLNQIYANARRPDPRYSGVFLIRNGNMSWYDAFQAVLRKRMSHGVQFELNYTHGKSLDTGSETTFTGIEVNAPVTMYDDLRSNKGYSMFDTPNRATFNWTYELPLFKDQKVHAFGEGIAGNTVGRILGGWQLSGTYIFASGTPFMVLAGYDLNADGVGGDRPNLLDNRWKGVSVNNAHIDPSTGLQYSQGQLPQDVFFPNFSTASAARTFTPGLLNRGNLGRFQFRGDGRNNVDAALQKNFRVTERTKFAFRWEIYNVANHPQFALPNGGQVNTISSTANWMKITRTANARQDNLSGARYMQFAVRYIF